MKTGLAIVITINLKIKRIYTIVWILIGYKDITYIDNLPSS